MQQLRKDTCADIFSLKKIRFPENPDPQIIEISIRLEKLDSDFNMTTFLIYGDENILYL